MIITVYEYSPINVGENRNEDNNQISFQDRDILLNKEFKDTKQNFYEKRYFKKKNIFVWNNSHSIKTTSIVGTIKIDDELTIEILPKIFNNNIDIKVARKNLIRLIEITEYEDIWDNETNIEADAENIPYLEFVILRFTTNLLEELQKGIYAEYITKIEESSFVRGAIQPHLQDIFDKSQIVCKFQELSFNNKLMQIFKTVSEHLLKNSMFCYEIKQNLFEITSILENVETLDKLEIFDFEHFNFTRLNESFELLFYQAKIIYFEYFPLNSDEDESTPYWAIYFDMDFLFEKFLNYLLEKSGFKVTEQEKIYTYKNNYITPDFILYNEKIVIDAKYTQYTTSGEYKNPNSKSIFQITNYMDNLDFEGSLIMLGTSSNNILFNNQMEGKSFNVITLDMGSNFDNIIDNFRFTINDNRLDFIFDESIFYQEESEELNLSNKNLSNDFNELVVQAKEYKQSKEWNKAIQCHKKLLEKSHNNHGKSFNLNNIGTCYYKDKDFYQAKENFLLSLEEEKNPFAYNFLGKIEFYENRNYEEAIKYYTLAISLSTNNDSLSYFYQDRGFSYRNINSYDNAINDFQEAIRLNNNLSTKLLNEIKRIEGYDHNK